MVVYKWCLAPTNGRPVPAMAKGASDGETKDSFVADARLESDTDDAFREPTNSPFLARRSAAR